jgi:hypothetical protein
MPLVSLHCPLFANLPHPCPWASCTVFPFHARSSGMVASYHLVFSTRWWTTWSMSSSCTYGSVFLYFGWQIFFRGSCIGVWPYDMLRVWGVQNYSSEKLSEMLFVFGNGGNIQTWGERRAGYAKLSEVWRNIPLFLPILIISFYIVWPLAILLILDQTLSGPKSIYCLLILWGSWQCLLFLKWNLASLYKCWKS